MIDLQNRLQKKYDRANWLNILSQLFPQLQLIRPHDISEKAEFVNEFFQLGYVELSDGIKLAVLELEVDSSINLPKNRIKLRKSTHKFIDNIEYQGVLAVYYSKDKGEYRFTFSAKEGKFEDGKYVEAETTPKRYTYLLGESEICRTAAKRFEMLSEMGQSMQVEDIKLAFSVESLNKDFYTKIQKAFYELLGGKTERKDYEGCLKLPSVNRETGSEIYKEFAVRLIGRLVFCWFLKHKKSESGLALMPDSILSSESVEDNYYHNILEKLFFETLNKTAKERNHSLPNAEQIPFLNGGLFEPKLHDYYKLDDVTNISRCINTLVVPDKWVKDFFEILEQYNFTIDENSSRDVQVSIDPEILGRIFENLLAELDPTTGETARKQTGSFYTPREIVDYMVEESLINYLSTHTERDKNELKTLFDDSVDESAFGPATNKSITEALSKIKIIDPACGSGAFPVGCLQKCLDILRKTDPNNDLFLDIQLNKIIALKLSKEEEDHWLKKVEAAFKTNEADYGRKLGLIQSSLYGVDLQPIAIEISKLRFFLTLIVDEKIYDKEENRGIEPLPNLELKFVAANSLVHLSETEHDPTNELGLSFYDEYYDKFEKGAEEYFYARSHDEKQKLKDLIETLIKNKVHEENEKIFSLTMHVDQNASRTLQERRQKEINYHSNKINLWSSFTNVFNNEAVDFFEPKFFFPDVREGFDIVIGNPPYQRIQGIKQVSPKLADYYKKTYKSATGSYDLYVLFMERGHELLSESGVLNFINPDKWVNASFGKGIRTFSAKDKNVQKIISFGAHQIFSASTYSSLVWMGKKEVPGVQYYEVEPLSGTTLEQELSKINAESFTINDYDFLTSEPWTLLSGKNAKVMNKLRKSSYKLLDFLKVFVGLQTSKDSVYFLRNAIFDNGLYVADSPELDKSVSIEEGLVKPLLLGEQVHRYETLKTGNIVIFPYLLNCDERPQLMTEEYIAENFPHGYSYLKECEEILRGRESGRFDNKEWFQFGRKQGIAFGKLEKLLAPDISLGGNFSYDPEGKFYTTTTLYGYLTKDNVKQSYEFWMALMNSSLVWYFIKNTGSVLANGYYRYKPAYLNNFPITVPSSDEQELIFINFVNYIQFLKKSEGRLVEISYFEQIIDALVYELYFPEEVKGGGISFIEELQAYVLPDILELNELEKMPAVHKVFDELYDKEHPVRRGIYFLDSIEIVRHIQESLRK